MVIKKRILILLLFLFLFSLTASGKVRIYKNIFYLSDSHVKHTLDLYLPEGEGFPVLVFVHGGGWKRGHKNEAVFYNLGLSFAEDGIGMAVIDYRLFPEVDYRGEAADVAAALVWVLKNIKKYGGNEKCVFIGGHSAGAHLSALIVTDVRWIQQQGGKVEEVAGLVAWSGIYDLTKAPPLRRRGRRAFRRSRLPASRIFGSSEEDRHLASPVFHVNEKVPPVLILYSDYQGPFFKNQAESFYKKLKEYGVEAKLVNVAGMGHVEEVRKAALKGNLIHREILDFIKKKCK